MNKFMTVVGVAAVATLAGCKDPDYHRGSAASRDEVKVADPIVVETPPPAPEAPSCKCPPGTKHASPCACGAGDCQCVVEVKPAPVVEVKPAPAPEPECTIYIVQNGDYLAKISKKFNVTVNSIKRLNNLKSDVIRIGQKLKLPGKLDVGVQTVPVNAKAAPAKKPAKAYAPYKGETKEYVVKSGDTLGAVAYGNGCTIRQLKELNGLTKDTLRIGQKLKIPAAGAIAAPTKAAPVKPEAKPAKVAAPVEPVVKPSEPVAPAEPTVAPVVETTPAPAPVAEPATSTYTVQEGDDMTGICIRWNVSAAAIRELNNLPEDAQLTPGQIIKVPADAQQ